MAERSKWDRDDQYRKTFLKSNKGLFGFLYICAYCGRPMTRKKMQVDHHIAINHVRNNPAYKLWFGLNNFAHNTVRRVACLATGKKFVKMQGVNVEYNLLPACPKCNRAKSDKGGMWIIRGYIGGGIWKILNAINNVLLWAWAQPITRVAVVGFVAFAVIQFALFGAGPIAAFLGFLNTLVQSFTVGLGAVFGLKFK